MSLFPVKNDSIDGTLNTPTDSVYKNGFRMNGDQVCMSTGTHANFSQGVSVDSNGAVRVVDATLSIPSGAQWQNGLLLSSDGAVCYSTGTVGAWSNGLPMASNGAHIANTLIPTPTRTFDFTSVTLDSAITFTRASGGTRVNASGQIELVSANTPRFDYDPITLAAKGLLIEEQRTNTIRNNTMVGAVAGTPGTLPTNWSSYTPQTGITREIVGVGTESGISFIDIKLTGTPSSSGSYAIYSDSTGGSATQGQAWNSSSFIKLQAGSFNGVSSVAIGVVERASNLSFLTQGTANISVDSGSFVSSRKEYTRNLTNASVAFAGPVIQLNLSGVAIDITLRIGLPQLELGSFATSVIPTSGAQATRAADVAVVTGTNFSSWYNQTAWTMFAEYDLIVSGSATLPSQAPGVCSFSNSDVPAFNGYGIQEKYNGQTRPVFAGRSGVTNPSTTRTTGYSIAGEIVKASMYIDSSSIGGVVNGVLCNPVTNTVYGVTQNQLLIGSQYISGSSPYSLNGHIKSLAYWNTRLTNTQLQTLTA